MTLNRPADQGGVRFGRYKAVVGPGNMGRSGKRPKDELKPGMLAEFLVKKVNNDSQTLEVELSQVPEIQPGLDLGHLRQLDLESLGIVVNLFNDKLGEHTRFQFVLWSFAAATHICRSDNRFISPKPNANLVGGWINGHYEAFYVFAFFILVAVPIRVFISLE